MVTGNQWVSHQEWVLNRTDCLLLISDTYPTNDFPRNTSGVDDGIEWLFELISSDWQVRSVALTSVA